MVSNMENTPYLTASVSGLLSLRQLNYWYIMSLVKKHRIFISGIVFLDTDYIFLLKIIKNLFF